MKIIRLGEEAYDEDVPESHGIDFMVYDYTQESYEGWGDALAYKDGKWYTHDLGHCSCYGPFEEFGLEIPFNTLTEAMEDLHGNDWSAFKEEAIRRMYEEAMKWRKEIKDVIPIEIQLEAPEKIIDEIINQYVGRATLTKNASGKTLKITIK